MAEDATLAVAAALAALTVAGRALQQLDADAVDPAVLARLARQCARVATQGAGLSDVAAAKAAQRPAPSAKRPCGIGFELSQLPTHAIEHTVEYLSASDMSAVDTTSQLFHPVSIIQKAAMRRAKRLAVPAKARASVRRREGCWPRWLHGIEREAAAKKQRYWRMCGHYCECKNKAEAAPAANAGGATPCARSFLTRPWGGRGLAQDPYARLLVTDRSSAQEYHELLVDFAFSRLSMAADQALRRGAVVVANNLLHREAITIVELRGGQETLADFLRRAKATPRGAGRGVGGSELHIEDDHAEVQVLKRVHPGRDLRQCGEALIGRLVAQVVMPDEEPPQGWTWERHK